MVLVPFHENRAGSLRARIVRDTGSRVICGGNGTPGKSGGRSIFIVRSRIAP